MSNKLRRTGTLAATLLIVAGSSCGPCTPPPSGHDVEIFLGTPNATVWFRDPAFCCPQGTYTGFGQAEMSPVDSIGLGQPIASVDVRYRSLGESIAAIFNTGIAGQPPIVFRRQPELHLFDLDPELQYNLLTGLDVTQWQNFMHTPSKAGLNTAPFFVPADMVIPYGSNTPTDIYPNQVEVDGINWRNFWVHEGGGVLTPTDWLPLPSTSAQPDGFGSIKAVYSIELPECSSGVKLQDTFFGPLQGQLNSQLTCQSGNIPDFCGGGTYNLFPSVTALNAMSYVRTGAVPGADDRAGVLVGGKFHMSGRTTNTCGFDWQPCDVTFLYDMQFSVDTNGYFAIVPNRINFVSTPGTMCNGAGDFLSGVKDNIQALLEITLPAMVHGTAKDSQKVPAPDTPPACNADGAGCSTGFDCCSRTCTAGTCAPSNKLPWSCSYAVNGLDSLPGSPYDVGTECLGAITELELAVSKAADALGVGSSAVRLNTIISDGNNWRCRRPNDAELVAECSQGKQVRGKCEFKVPANFIVAEPDEIRLGFEEVDGFVTATNNVDLSTYPPHTFQSNVAFLAAYLAGGVPEIQQKICSPAAPLGSSNYYNRYFATLSSLNVSCTPPTPPGPPPPPPPKLLCGCASDSDCAKGDTCSGGVCAHACNTAGDCHGSGTVPAHCYNEPCVNNGLGVVCPAIHLCASAVRGCTKNGGCFAWEHCDTTIDSTGLCVENPQVDGYPD